MDYAISWRPIMNGISNLLGGVTGFDGAAGWEVAMFFESLERELLKL
jgi:hypothetical protein